jgi:hypothetical protein
LDTRLAWLLETLPVMLALPVILRAKARILSIEIASQGEKVTISDAAPEGSGISAWFGKITGGVVAVAGSQAGKYGFEDQETQSGTFSHRFQRALQDLTADTNQDSRISIAEAEPPHERHLSETTLIRIRRLPAQPLTLHSSPQAGPNQAMRNIMRLRSR